MNTKNDADYRELPDESRAVETLTEKMARKRTEWRARASARIRAIKFDVVVTVAILMIAFALFAAFEVFAVLSRVETDGWFEFHPLTAQCASDGGSCLLVMNMMIALVLMGSAALTWIPVGLLALRHIWRRHPEMKSNGLNLAAVAFDWIRFVLVSTALLGYGLSSTLAAFLMEIPCEDNDRDLCITELHHSVYRAAFVAHMILGVIIPQSLLISAATIFFLTKAERIEWKTSARVG